MLFKILGVLFDDKKEETLFRMTLLQIYCYYIMNSLQSISFLFVANSKILIIPIQTKRVTEEQINPKSVSVHKKAAREDATKRSSEYTTVCKYK